MVRYRMLPDGGFVAGDTYTEKTSYAYPTSTHATIARRLPERVALEMVQAANRLKGCDTTNYDLRMWAMINAA